MALLGINTAPAEQGEPPDGGLPRGLQALALGLVLAGWAIISVLAPPNLLQHNENRMAAYVADIVHNGRWIYPRDALGQLMSKPPAHAWLAALVARASGRIDGFALHFPSALSALLIAWLLARAGRHHGGPAAGFWAAFAWLASPAFGGLLATSRYDGLFGLCVLAMALAALRAWETGRGWTMVWLAGAAATLVKGPLGLALGGAGLLAVLWDRRSPAPAPLRGSQVAGLCMFAGTVGLWCVLALWDAGPAMLDRLVGDELVGHSVGLHDVERALAWHRPLGSWLGKLAPWSLLAVFAMVRALRHPSPDAPARRCERFFTVALITGLILFTLTPHRQSRMIVPLLPFGALLAGLRLASWTRRAPAAHLAGLLAGAVVMTLGVAGYERLVKDPRAESVRGTWAAQELARQWRALAGAGFPLTHVDPPVPFQLALQEVRPFAAVDHARNLLYGSEAAVVVLSRAAASELPLDGGPPWRLLTTPEGSRPAVEIWSNREHPDPNEPVVCLVGDIALHLEGVVLVRAIFNHVAVRPRERPGRLRLTNQGPAATPMHVIVEGRSQQGGHHLLAPGETWVLDVFP
jgi:4-amino-4-deoxy-L-arabinose transferase-like glycosyltransferase